MVDAVSFKIEVSKQDQRSTLLWKERAKIAKRIWWTIDPSDMKFTRFRDNNRMVSNKDVKFKKRGEKNKGAKKGKRRTLERVQQV